MNVHKQCLLVMGLVKINYLPMRTFRMLLCIEERPLVWPDRKSLGRDIWNEMEPRSRGAIIFSDHRVF